METEFDLTKRMTKKIQLSFAEYLLNLQDRLDFRISSRGWAYYLESERLINKDQFDKVEDAINRCRKQGLIPIDFVAEEPARGFENVHIPSSAYGTTMRQIVCNNLQSVLDGDYMYEPDWWEGEEYYIQMIVEKIDLKSLFTKICKRFHIPIATSKGWSSMLQRAEYARRFKVAEDMGMQCVLLYCGDHDPDGLRISDFLRSNLRDLQDINWNDGETGYDPTHLIIDRFGLNKKLIDREKLTWIDNLITGSGKDLASSAHINNGMPYVQEYIKDIGVRKCEANAIIPKPQAAYDLCTDTITGYLGADALKRFWKKREKAKKEYLQLLNESGVSTKGIRRAIEKLQG